MTMIETTDLTKRYGDVTAVDGVDIRVEEGSLHGFVGHNGAGKSTTMQMLVGLVTPTAGEAHVGGERVGSAAATERIGYAPQEPEFYDAMSGRAYLEYMGRLADIDGAVDERAAELLSWLDLEDAADQAIGGYSGGMQRKLGMAQALLEEPDVLVLDEPTATLDPEGRAAIIESLRGLTDDGTTVFVSSHVLAELEQFIDTVTIMKNGHIAAAGAVDEVLSDVQAETFLLDSSDNRVLASALSDHDSVEQVRHRDDSRLTVVADDPGAFTAAIPGVCHEAGLGLRTLEQKGGLEETFLDIVDAEEDAS
jgi:ABC-2 type transport system ATP-binding protein